MTLFEETEDAVQRWIGENPRFNLILSDENEKRWYFDINNSTDGNSSFSFYIELPTEDRKRWVVKSDCDDQKILVEAKKLCANTSDLNVEQLLNCINSAEDMELDDDDCDDAECDDDEEDYYMGGNEDYHDDSAKKAVEKVQEEEAFSLSAQSGNPVAIKRLLADMKSLNSSQGKFGVSGTPRGDNLFIWDVKLTDLEPKSRLAEDLATYSKKFKREKAILLEMTFQDTYPMTPPFVRVIRPKFKFLTGHVTIGGSICMQMLTRSGWSPSNDIEGILIQIRSEIMSDPEARLEMHRDVDYTEGEAKDAFKRMVMKYQWS